MTALIHGGQLHNVAQQFQRPLEQWLDLSTGISPFSYPIPQVPQQYWQQLPQPYPPLLKAASNYYGTSNLLATAGSQAIIQLFPSYRLSLGYSKGRVWLPLQGYKEHQRAWQQTGFAIIHYQQLPDIDELQTQDIVVVINPNNPTAMTYSQNVLSALHKRLSLLNGWLIVDEAFMDVAKGSLLTETDSMNLFVLRSIGKFFGLAGIRLGFVAANSHHLSPIQQMLGPWQVNGPAQFIAAQALADSTWQQQQRGKLAQQSELLKIQLEQTFQTTVFSTPLFCTLYLPNAKQVYRQLCEHGVYVRLTDEEDALRFGTPTKHQLSKLKQILSFCDK